MRKPRDFDTELKALEDRARDLKARKVQQLGELVISTGADALTADELAGALVVLAETKDAGKREAWAKRADVGPWPGRKRTAWGEELKPGKKPGKKKKTAKAASGSER